LTRGTLPFRLKHNAPGPCCQPHSHNVYAAQVFLDAFLTPAMLAADIDAAVLLCAPSLRGLHRAVDDPRLLGGAQDTAAHRVLGRIGLPANGSG
jgi:hypothetical protein